MKTRLTPFLAGLFAGVQADAQLNVSMHTHPDTAEAMPPDQPPLQQGDVVNTATGSRQPVSAESAHPAGEPLRRYRGDPGHSFKTVFPLQELEGDNHFFRVKYQLP